MKSFSFSMLRFLNKVHFFVARLLTSRENGGHRHAKTRLMRNRATRCSIFFFVVLGFALCMQVQAAVDETETPTDKSTESDDEKVPKAARELEEHYGLCEDEEINAKLERVSMKILDSLSEEEKENWDFKFKVLDDDMVNALAMSDGHMYFFRGLVELTKTDDQLAGVVGHELTHVIHKHSKKIVSESLPWMIGGIAAAVVSKEPLVALAGEMFAQAHAEQYGRKAEEDADQYGLKLMIRAGYDPIGMLQFFSFLMEEEKRNPHLFQNYFLVHPYSHERIDSQKKLLREMGYYVPDSIIRSWLESGIKAREEGGVNLVDIEFGGELLFTIAGHDAELLEQRARSITATLDEIIKSGASRFNFRIAGDEDRAWIQAKGRIFYEPEDLDIENSGVDRDEYLKTVLKKIQRLLWEERVKQRI